MKTEVTILIDSGLADYVASIEDGRAILQLVLADKKLEIARDMEEIAGRRQRERESLASTTEEEDDEDDKSSSSKGA